ncbi:hypothetical protein LTR70_008505 [Exophiala xenobiotica]|uniref:Nudix hydrolase domain-containing protein n=1 Tax=Lithohypha guttulata TaxID=1690604 RepID=A0ABR0K4A5_9EURO|nr:hypothetical protein LTR24_007033 [Lithohypha guttulata]KAK5311936.1 hypothetical protein LTR70_008505 [Exophiala xenobiotica]
MTESRDILGQLHSVLNNLQTLPYPHVSTPEGCKKRASVAVIIRVRPAFQPASTPNESLVDLDNDHTPASSIDEFFARPWVREGDPEVLFIKRAGRAGDRWSGHIALPGGKRDPEDESDIAAAVRETREEVGLDLSVQECLEAGNLPERIVATTFGQAPLMVLCPYIFIYTTKTTPPLRPSPDEVASVHWVPLRALLSPSLRTRIYVDTASRMAKQGGPVLQFILRLLVGRMMLSAVKLVPAESVYATSVPGFIPTAKETTFSGLAEGAFGIPASNTGLAHLQPLMLWGLTLGVLADFLDMLPPYNAVKLWNYPTFTPPDLRAFVWAFTYGMRKNNAHDLSAGTWPYKNRRRRASQTAMDATSFASAVTEGEPTKMSGKGVGVEGSGMGNPQDAVGRLLEGYYYRLNVAIAAFLMYRTAAGSAIVYYLWKLWKNRRARL